MEGKRQKAMNYESRRNTEAKSLVWLHVNILLEKWKTKWGTRACTDIPIRADKWVDMHGKV